MNRVYYDYMQLEDCYDSFSTEVTDIILSTKYSHRGDDLMVFTYSNLKVDNDMQLNISNGRLAFSLPPVINKLILSINECELCDGYDQYEFDADNSIDLIYCPYYTEPANKIKRWYKNLKRLPVLWKIAEYYTARKYHPDNALKYIKLD